MPCYVRTAKELAVTCEAIATWTQSCDAELLVVDDCSPDDELKAKLLDFIEQFDHVQFEMRPSNEGFSATVNVGLLRARDAEMDAVLVNSDIEFMHQGWLETMDSNDAWIVGALLVYPNRLIQHAGVYFSVITRTFDHIYRFAPGNLPAAHEKRVCPVTGALQLIRLEALKTIGLYDINFRMGWEDVSYCTDVFSRGERCVYEPHAVAIHHESLFRGRNKDQKIHDWEQASWAYLHTKHAGLDFSEWCPTLLDEGAME